MGKEILRDVQINDLIPYDKNYLNHDNNREFIKNSIGTFDFTTPIEVDENMVILAGHGRLEAAKMLNMETIPFILKISGWDEAKKTAYRYANNSTAKEAQIWATDRKQTTILNFERPTKSTEHPTMKPTALFAYQLQNNTKGDDIVLDNFLGSGTTLLACEQTNRICYGMELDEKYCDVIVQRWVNLTGGKVILNGNEIEWSKSDG